MVVVEIGMMAIGALGVAYAYVEVDDGLKRRRQNEAIAAADPTDPVDDTDGPTAVEGTVVAEDAIPVGEQGSVAIQADVWQYGLSEDNEYLDLEERNAVPFSVDTGDATIRVDAETIDVEASDARTVSETVEAGDRPTGVAGQYAAYREFGPLPSGGKRDYDVERIEPGDEVIVFGETSQREDQTVVTSGDGAFFVTDEDPQTLRERRKHVFKKAVAKAVPVGVIGVGVLLAGLVALFL